jgi:hypothetical protein
MEKCEFDFDEILKALRSDKKFAGKSGLLAPLVKHLQKLYLKQR